ncbi:MAG: ferredoxin [bacterium]
MTPFRQHYFVCTHARPPFAKPSCGPQTSHQILMKLQEEAEKQNLLHEIKITACACLGPCEAGPSMVVYPDGIWYAKVTLEDVPEIVSSHMLQNKPIERLIYHWPENI